MTVPTITLLDVQESYPDGLTPHWQVLLEKEDGTRYLHVFPKDTLLNRAVEYGLDPADVDTLLTLVLQEPHMPNPSDPISLPPEGDPAVAAGLVAPTPSGVHLRPGQAVAVTLGTAETVAQARAAQEARLAWCREHRAKVVLPGKMRSGQRRLEAQRVLDRVRDEHEVDDHVLAEAQERVRRDFACHRAEAQS